MRFFSRPVVFVAAAVLCPLFVTQCRTTAGNYKDIEYDADTLKTPPGHNLEKKDYPFDDSGNYRKDWVKNKSRGKTRSSTGAPPEPDTTTSAAPVQVAAAGGQGGYYGPAGTVASPDLTAPPAAPAAPRYHEVVTGDTLFSLAGRYQTSVDDLKRVNGLTSDSIRTGQSLRIP
ncbi:MAG: LysM peptidoglycan-binding domain-containing protein [Verrucomicrobiales bacterium]|nr:LysM peptidoglycan-binding domain-containing protein [Verrucomicrobiales bacterium]